MFKPEIGKIYEGTVARVYPNYAILIFEEGFTGLLHISELSDKFIRNFPALVQVGKIYSVKVYEIDETGNNAKVSVKRITPEERKNYEKYVKIDPSTIDFTKLKENLPNWIDEQLKKGEDQND